MILVLPEMEQRHKAGRTILQDGKPKRNWLQGQVDLIASHPW
jgi:hypothetical protein